jgi:hypothetical protein
VALPASRPLAPERRVTWAWRPLRIHRIRAAVGA